MGKLETKAVVDFVIKDAERGEVTAIVSTFNVVDRDGDVILPGAIQDGAVVKLSGYGHDVVTGNAAPAGKGIVRIAGDRAIFEGRFFLSTQRGADAFAVIKELGPGGSEWSIGYLSNVRTAKMTDAWREQGARRLIASLDLLEVSPVFLGANQFTATVGVKEHIDEDDAAAQAVAFAAAVEQRATELALQAKADADAVTKADEDARVAAEAEAAAAQRAKGEDDLRAMAAEVKARREAENATIAAMVAERIMEIRDAREAHTTAAEQARIADLARKEFEHFQRTRRRMGVG